MHRLFTEGGNLSDWLKGEQEQPKDWTRSKVRLVDGTIAVSGTVLGMVTESGYYTPLDPDSSDGSQNAKAILLLDAEISTDGENEVAAHVAVLARGSALVVRDKLTWPPGADDTVKDTAMAALAALGIREVEASA